jgi:drug/metabolite transporter (DMT)-like permease
MGNMAIFLMIFAACCVAVSNLFMRKSIDEGGTTKGFLVFQMAMAFVVALLLNPVRTANYSINLPIVGFGLLAGLILSLMLFFLGRSIEKGPAGLTFSVLNAATVMPGIVMASLFGIAYGFPYTTWHAIGSLVVLLGLFMAGKGLQVWQDRKRWMIFVFAMFSLHILILVLFQFRALLLNLEKPAVITSFFSAEQIKSQWFSPMMFLAAFAIQLLFFLFYERRWPRAKEAYFGLIGGLMNGICTYLMIWSTEVAGPLENAVIYPIFSVMGIFLSNLWSQRLYQEKVDWKACQFCAAGLVIGTVNWKAVASFIGF